MANLVGQMCASVDLVTLLGSEDSREDFVRASLNPNVNLVPFYRQDGQTTVKSRLVDPAYVKKLIEIAYISDEALPAPEQAALNGWVEANIANYDAVIGAITTSRTVLSNATGEGVACPLALGGVGGPSATMMPESFEVRPLTAA